MKSLIRDLRHGLRIRIHILRFRAISALLLGIGIVAIGGSAVSSAAALGNDATAKKEIPPWERMPPDMRAATEANKQALQLITAVFEARLRRAEVEMKFLPTIGSPDKKDPLSGPNDLAASPLLQEFGQGAIWLSVILSARPSDLSPRLQQIQRGLLEDLPQAQTANPGGLNKELKKEIRKPVQSKQLEDDDTAQEIRRILQAERNYQEVVSQLRAVFPNYAELYRSQSPRVLNPPGKPTVFELCDPVVSADPLAKNERMQASLMVKIYRPDDHNFKIVSFWLYRTIEDWEGFVPRELYSEKGKDVTRNSYGRWDQNHMPPRTFSAEAYVSPAVTVLNLRFVEGQPIISGRSVPAGRHRAQPVDLAGVDLTQLNPSNNGALDVSAPSFPVSIPEIPRMPALILTHPQVGVDYMPRLREPYEFHSQAEYEAYKAGIRDSTALYQQSVVTPQPTSTANTEIASVSVPTQVAPMPKPTALPSTPVNVGQLHPVFLDPQQQDSFNELSSLARESLKQYSDLKPVSSVNFVNQALDKANAGFRHHDPGAELLQPKLPKVSEVNVYFLASENTSASWRGPDDNTGKGGIVVILPNRYYFDPQQFYPNVAGALINQPLTTAEVANLSKYLAGNALQTATTRQFAIGIEYVDHGWDEDGDMRKWADEEVEFFRHLQEAMTYLKPRLETIAPADRAALEAELPVVQNWLSSLGDTAATINFGLYKGKGDAPPPRADSAARTLLISCKAEDYVRSQQKENRWPLMVKLIEALNGLSGSRLDPGMTGAIYDILAAFAKDKDNKLMIAWRLNTDLPAKPADWPALASVPRPKDNGSASANARQQ
jgi:hypothetical protein